MFWNFLIAFKSVDLLESKFCRFQFSPEITENMLYFNTHIAQENLTHISDSQAKTILEKKRLIEF